MDPKGVCFIINNQIVNVHPPDEFTLQKYRSDRAFAIDKIAKLVNMGKIQLNEAIISRIALVENDYEIVLYDLADSNQQNNDENSVPAETNSSGSKRPSQKPEESSLNTPSTSQSQTGVSDPWGDAETTYILDQYYSYMSQIGPMKKFKTKKAMWTHISHDFLKKYKISKTPVQIENRYKTVLRRKKDAVNNNSQSGNSREDVPFETELTKIASLDDSIEPEVIRSAKRVKILKSSQNFICHSNKNDDDDNDDESEMKNSNGKLRKEQSTTKKGATSTVQLLKKLHAEKEASKQRRHEEKMNLMRELFSNVQNNNESESD